MTYATAGVQMGAGIEMNVRSHVFIPDAEAGCEDVRSYYRAGFQVERKKEMTLSLNHAAIFLLILAAVLALIVGLKAMRYADETQAYRTTMNAIEKTNEENASSAQALAQARDSHRIRYLATTEYGMIPADAVDAIPVVAPQTRTQNSNTSGLTAENPFAGGYGMLSGSR